LPLSSNITRGKKSGTFSEHDEQHFQDIFAFRPELMNCAGRDQDSHSFFDVEIFFSEPRLSFSLKALSIASAANFSCPKVLVVQMHKIDKAKNANLFFKLDISLHPTK